MKLQRAHRALRGVFLSCACFVLAAAGLAVALIFRGGDAPADPLIASRDGLTLRRGAVDFSGPETTVSRSRLLQGTLMLVSPQTPLPPDYPAPSTRAIRAMVGSYLPALEGVALRQEAIYALCSIQADHDLSGQLRITQGAVSAAQQEEARREALQRFLQVCPLQEALEKAARAVPGGGQSEHQSGYAVDIDLTVPLALGEENPLRRNPAGQWLDENMWRYGFVQRYAPGGQDAGTCESVHLRYVGPVHAAAMHALGMGLEEYLDLLRTERCLTLLRQDQPWACILCAPCADDWRLSLPASAVCSFSADNTGWAIAAVEMRGF